MTLDLQDPILWLLALPKPKLFSHQILQCTWSGLGLIAIYSVSELWEGVVREDSVINEIKGFEASEAGGN